MYCVKGDLHQKLICVLLKAVLCSVRWNVPKTSYRS